MTPYDAEMNRALTNEEDRARGLAEEANALIPDDVVVPLRAALEALSKSNTDAKRVCRYISEIILDEFGWPNEDLDTTYLDEAGWLAYEIYDTYYR